MSLEKLLAGAPLFFQPWWLNLVAGEQWKYLTVKRGEEVTAVWPIVFRERWGRGIMEMPRMTPYLGPWLRESTAKYANRLSEEKELLTVLIDQLPDYAFFYQRFHCGLQNWLPFFWKGFEATVHYTYRIENTTDLEAAWAETRDNIRTDVKKARKKVEIEETDDFQHVIDMQKLTLGRQGMVLPHSEEFLREFGKTCREQGAGKTFLARDAEGRVHACVHLLMDDRTVYYYTGGGDPELRSSGAASFLVWHAIEYASKTGRVFDFEGSMLEPVERFFRAFGARQTPYFVLQHNADPLFAFAKTGMGFLKKTVRRLKGAKSP